MPKPVRRCIQITGDCREAADRLWVTISADRDEQLACSYIDSGCIRVPVFLFILSGQCQLHASQD